MNENFDIHFISPSNKISLTAYMATLPGSSGKFSVLAHHENLVASLKSGTVIINDTTHVKINDGFAHILNGILTITSDSIEQI